MAALSLLRKTYEDQRRLLRLLWGDYRFRIPLLVIWVASFGGALHAPVTTYFYLEVGASETAIGAIEAVKRCIQGAELSLFCSLARALCHRVGLS